MRHLAQWKRLPFTAVFGRAFFPSLKVFFTIRTSSRILSECSSIVLRQRQRKGRPLLGDLSRGFHFGSRFTLKDTLKNVVLVAMTGYGQESDRKRSKEAGFDHHLVKPGDFGKVLQILATVAESPAP